jgi:prepilin-type N-terminal cleavage/methylation domain-containing protein
MFLRRFVRHDDRGVTLTEVLVAVAILGIIAVPLGNAMINFLRQSDSVNQRLSESHDVQVAAAYFAQDVQSIGVRNWGTAPFALAQSIETNAPPTTGLYPCGRAGLPNALVRFGWDDPATAAGTPSVVRVAYIVVTAGGERQLQRLTCVGSSTPTSTLVLAHNVHTTTPTVVCANPSTCSSATVPQTVTLTIQIKDPANTGSALTVILKGQRRQT